jgi:phage terminase large subunit-like protein
MVPTLTNDAEQAERFLRLAGEFVLTQGSAGVAGRRLKEVWLPWQPAALKAMFQARESFLLLGKGSGKSTLCAAYAIAAVMLAALDGRNYRSQVVIVASSIATARIVFDHVQMCILSDDELRPMWKSNVQAKSITHVASGIEIRVISCSLASCVGLRPLLIIVDELHEVSFIADSTAAIQQLRAGSANWGNDAKVISISTAPPQDAVGEYARLLDYARGVRDGRIDDPSFLPLLYEFPLLQRPDLSPDDPAQWWRGMPSLSSPSQPGTMSPDEMAREIRMALDGDNKQQYSLVLSQRLGIPADLRDSTAETIFRARWPGCPHLTEAVPTHGTIVIGIDPGGLDDPFGCATIWVGEDRTLNVVSEQHIVETGYRRAPDFLKHEYDLAIAAGTLKVHKTTDELEKAVINYCIRISQNNRGSTFCGGDQHGRAGFAARFQTEGGMTFRAVPQSWQLGSALRSLEGRLDDGMVRHIHDPLMAFNVRSLKVEETANGNLRLGKRDAASSGQGSLKIDGAIALINAVFMLDEAQVTTANVSWMIA